MDRKGVVLASPAPCVSQRVCARQLLGAGVGKCASWWRPTLGSRRHLTASSGAAGSLGLFYSRRGRAVEAVVDRLIPPDKSGPGGKDAGCAVFIDRQLAGAFGDSRDLFMRPPFAKGTPRQGPQSSIVPQESYRASLAALDGYCKTMFAGKAFASLDGVRQDHVLTGLENGEIKYPDGDGKAFFEMILANTIEGFFADPIYGGNRDMVGWKLIGFPGARYDYRDHVAKHNEPYPLPPVSILGRAEWSIRD
jgi:gluconate 2-dehydrogenase gamma chain